MPVRYCLGIEHQRVAGATEPYNVRPLRDEFRRLVPELTFNEVVGIPSFIWTNELEKHVLAQLSFAGHDDAKRFRVALVEGLSRTKELSGKHGFSPDPSIFAMDSWTPTGSGGGIFGDRDDAERLTGIAGFSDQRGNAVTGQGVNVVIVDRGLCRTVVQHTADRMAARRKLPPGDEQLVLGWTRYERADSPCHPAPRYPGENGSDHGYMIARNILAIAPDAVIWDAPLLPSDDEPDAPPGPSSACQLFHHIRDAVRKGVLTSWNSKAKKRMTVKFTQPLIIVNAWGVMDPESDKSFADYADDPNNFLVNDMALLEKEGIDVVFAAGNCGEPGPDPRCGQAERGPGCSIYGMNAHPSVLTVGAVRADGLPLALSAQGPGRLAPGLRAEHSPWFSDAFYKPDLCAPSHFRESDDAQELNTGTSAACGFAAGIVAALRSVPAARDLKPAWLRTILRETAQPIAGKGWDPRLGFGIINSAAALALIEK